MKSLSKTKTKAVKTAPKSYSVTEGIKFFAVDSSSLQQYQREAKKLLADDILMKYTGAGPRNKDQAQKELEEWNQHWKKHGLGNYFVVDISLSKLVGFAKLYHSIHAPNLSIGYLIDHPYQRQGLGTKTAQTLLQIGFEYLNQPALFAFTRLKNQSSRRILDKVGFECLTESYFANDRQFAQYLITAERYQPINYN